MPPQRAARKAVSRRTRSSKRPHPDRNDGADLDGPAARSIVFAEVNAACEEICRAIAQLNKQTAEIIEYLREHPQAQTASIGSSAGSCKIARNCRLQRQQQDRKNLSMTPHIETFLAPQILNALSTDMTTPTALRTSITPTPLNQKNCLRL